MKKHEPDINIEIKQSNYLLSVMLLLHFFALIACVINALPVWINLLLGLIVGADFFYCIRKYYRRQGGYQLHYSTANAWQIVWPGQKAESISIQADTLLYKQLVMLHYKNQSNRSYRLLILKDALSEPEFSLLAAQLKLSQINC